MGTTSSCSSLGIRSTPSPSMGRASPTAAAISVRGSLKYPDRSLRVGVQGSTTYTARRPSLFPVSAPNGSPQGLAHFSTTFATGVTRVEFVDWLEKIGIRQPRSKSRSGTWCPHARRSRTRLACFDQEACAARLTAVAAIPRDAVGGPRRLDTLLEAAVWVATHYCPEISGRAAAKALSTPGYLRFMAVTDVNAEWYLGERSGFSGRERTPPSPQVPRPHPVSSRHSWRSEFTPRASVTPPPGPGLSAPGNGTGIPVKRQLTSIYRHFPPSGGGCHPPD